MPNAALNSPLQPINPKTLAEFNSVLKNLSLGPVAKDQLDVVLETEPRERLVSALNRARNDPRALSYLNRFFGKDAMSTGSVPPSSADPAVPRFREDPLPAPSSSQSGGGVGQPQVPAERPEEKREYLKKHIYGGKAALCFEADETRGGMHTVGLDAADSTGPKQYDWSKKIRVQLTRDEILVVTAVFFGFLPRCEFKNHGEGNDKGFSIEDQGDKLFVRVFAKGQNIKAVPITPEDAFYVATILLAQMQKNTPWLVANELLLTLQRVAAARKTNRPQGGPGSLAFEKTL